MAFMEMCSSHNGPRDKCGKKNDNDFRYKSINSNVFQDIQIQFHILENIVFHHFRVE